MFHFNTTSLKLSRSIFYVIFCIMQNGTSVCHFIFNFFFISHSDSRRPVCLPPQDLGLKGGDNLVVTGWGHLAEKGSLLFFLFNRTLITQTQFPSNTSNTANFNITWVFSCRKFVSKVTEGSDPSYRRSPVLKSLCVRPFCHSQNDLRRFSDGRSGCVPGKSSFLSLCTIR